MLLARPASADDKAACLDAASSGQKLRDVHKLLEARDQFRLCAAAACPAVVQTDCAGWLASVERNLPTVVITAKDRSGASLIDVKVTMDGQAFATTLTGRAVPVDPGPHTFHFEGPGGALDQTVVAAEGDQDVRVAVVIGSAEPRDSEQGRREPVVPGPAPSNAAAPAAMPPPSVPTPQPTTSVPDADVHPTEGHTQRTIGELMLAIGLPVGGIATLAFGGIALGKWSNAQNECQPGVCGSGSQAQNDLKDARAAAQNSTILGVITGAVLVGGIALRVTAPSPRRAATTVVPVVASGGGGFVLQGGFQ
jgi:hypothetical protein